MGGDPRGEPHSLQRSGVVYPLAQLTIHAFDGRAHRFGNCLDVAPGHLQLRAPELRLNVAWFAMLLKVRCTGAAKRLVCHAFDARLLGGGFR